MHSLIKYFTLLAFISCLIIGLIIGPKKIAMFLNNKAVEQYNKGNMQSAIDFYLKSIKFNPDAQVYYNLACAYDAQKRTEQAIEHYKNALSLDAKHPAACQALADIFRERNEFDQAEMYLKKLTALNIPNAQQDLADFQDDKKTAMFNAAINDYEQGRIQPAIGKLKEIVRLDQRFIPAHKMLGEIYFSQNDLGKALSSYNAVLRYGDSSAQVYSNMGLIYMQLENYPKSVEYLEKAYKLDPDSLEIKYSFASVLRDNGQAQKALYFFKQIAEQSPDYPNIHNDLAGIYRGMNAVQDAEMEFFKAKDSAVRMIASGDNQPWTSLSLAIACHGLGDSEKAETILNKIIAQNPDFQQAYYIRAQVYEKLGDKQSANSDLKTARQLARRVQAVPNLKIKRIKPDDSNNTKKEEAKPDIIMDSDTIIKLTNGQTMRGKLKKETEGSIVLEMDMGSSAGEITFSKKKIQEIIKTK
jgi:tetratricopeptide (TPR) repeat protein